MELIIQIWGGLALSALFLKSWIERQLAKTSSKWPLELWHIAFRILWGGMMWAMATVLSSMFLHSIFPKEPAYLLAGSWITVAPALLWGALTLWIISGKREAGDGDPEIATVDGRLDAMFAGMVTIVVRSTKFILWGAGALIAIGLIYLFSTWVNKEVAEMAPSSAIVLGAVIIAWAIYATRR
jgi:hypothetical protein